MGSWSVDGLHKLDDTYDYLTVARLVSANDLEAKGSGIRYVGIPPESSESYLWGRCISPVWGGLERRDDLMGLRILTRGSPVEYYDDTEELLRRGVSELLEPVEAPVEEADDTLAALIRKKDVWARIHVHNVGQGDTIVIELPGNQYWMIDARLWGAPRRADFDKWMQRFEGKTFSKLIVSHFHYDHIHSIPYIIETYNPQEVVVPGSLRHPTITTQRVLSTAGNRLAQLSAQRVFRFGELEIVLFDSIRFTPHAMNHKDPNYHEVGVCMRTPKTRVLLAGDMPYEQCEGATSAYLASSAPRSYYKVSHHGSRTGCSSSFVNSLAPSYSVISCGKQNRYSHPHDPPLNLLPGYVERTDHMARLAVDTYEVK